MARHVAAAGDAVTFGDLEPDDVYDPSPPDPEQVARRLHRFRQARQLEASPWESLSVAQRLVLIAVVGELLDLLRREGSLR